MSYNLNENIPLPVSDTKLQEIFSSAMTQVYLWMAIGLIIASVVNMFLASSALDWIITYAGILIFMGLTVYDTKRIKMMTYALAAQGEVDVIGRAAVIGSLRLYLDFINLFLYILRLLGRRRR